MKVGFAVLPNDDLVDAIISFQSQMNEVIEWVPKLSYMMNQPHITLIQGDFPNSLRYISILNALQSYLSSITFPLSAAVLDIFYQPIGWYFLRIQREQWLVDLHNHLFGLVKQEMKPGVADPEKQKWFTPLELRNFCTYGYRYIGDTFSPHITLGRNQDLSKLCLISKMNQRWGSLNIASLQAMKQITVYEMGENGSHARTMASLSI